MECPQHKGRDMDTVLVTPQPCPTCGGTPAPEQIGYVCRFDGKRYNLDGSEYAPPQPTPIEP